jgi:sugar lactone lactonase YvrE
MKAIFEIFLGRLIVADAYYGLYRVNVESGSKEVLVPASLDIEGKKNLVTNSVAVSKDGKTIYFTTSRYS